MSTLATDLVYPVKPEFSFIRTIDPAKFPVVSNEFDNGDESRILIGATPYGARLELEYKTLNPEEVNTIFTFYCDCKGTFLRFKLSDQFFKIACTPPTIKKMLAKQNPSGLWRFEDIPKQSLEENLINVQNLDVTLLGVIS